ncbi:MAG TPA: YtxH domain-containing protein [Promineifilum sp.]|nr:YtxH domain-containing protein [Promineifilum sp.]
MSDNDSDLGAFLAGFVIGSLVGAATAIILAPQSGQATRDQLLHFSDDIRNVGGERFEQVRQAADTYSREYRDRASAVISDTRNRAQTFADQATEQTRIVLDAGRDAAQDATDSLNSSG